MAPTRASLMEKINFMDKRGIKKSRLVYIYKIKYKLKLSKSTLIPTAAEDRSFKEALHHVVHVVSRNECTPVEGPFSCDLRACRRTGDRKQCLKKIFDQLCWIERRRLYDPPADNEIGRYLLIKKYTRSILAFNLAAERNTYPANRFGCSSLYNTLHYIEELMEINRYLVDLSETLSDMKFEDGFTLAALVGIKDSNEMVPVSRGSKEKSYMFYSHKFQLASIDLRNSEFGYCPPFEDEERCYAHVLDDIATPMALIGIEDETNIYSEELFNFYLERIYQEMVNIERHFAKMKDWILKTLSLEDWWVAKQIREIECEEPQGNKLAEFRKQLADNCVVSNNDLPDYISRVDCCLTIALIFVALVVGCSEKRAEFNGIKLLRGWKLQVGWEALHALTLFKHGSHVVGSLLQEQPILWEPKKLVSLENHPVIRKHENILHQRSHDNNVKILEEIIDYLRCIGDSHIELDKEEMILLHKIWGSVASSTHFFVSAMAYEQRQYVIEHRELFNLSMLGLPTKNINETIDLTTVIHKQSYWKDDILYFVQFLEAYKEGLVEKLRDA